MREEIHNGMSATDVPGATWCKSSYSNPSGNCVEMAWLEDGRVAIRNSRFPDGAVLLTSAEEFGAFVAGTKAGRMDDPLH